MPWIKGVDKPVIKGTTSLS